MSNKKALTYNAKEVQQDFKNLTTLVDRVSSRTAATVLANQDAFKMTFDETEAIPITVPSSGTIMLSGSSGSDAVILETIVSKLAAQSLESMSEELTSLMKEAGYD